MSPKKELRLFREIKDAKDRLEQLYNQMNQKLPGHEATGGPMRNREEAGRPRAGWQF